VSKPQKVKVGIGLVSVSTGWTGATVRISAFRGNIERIAILEINEPYELKYLRDQLDLIVVGWQKRLAEVTSE
jgi:hypothetical protein